MIFAIIDYLRYRRRQGRFSRDPRFTLMAGAFESALPHGAVNLLQLGDVLLVQTLDSTSSWLVMYGTSSEVSHVAIYAGNGDVVHSTTGGVRIEPITALYGKTSRILPCKWELSDDTRYKYVESAKSFEGTSYGWLAIVLKAVRILTARDWPYFRWKFAFDIVLVLAILDVPIIVTTGHPVLLWAVPVYMMIILFNAILWRFKPLTFSEWTGKPVDVLRMIQSNGGSLVVDAYNLQHHSRESKC